ncbi:hypothetical protein [Brevundimonas sp. UBA7534]|uniref:hypothetical protein n=1 Tax=Brevundimonas sp. UBA7534 TaxID=1946138 RepID=UPI0025C4D4C4|nr:hypothetical protein [Brevundimonas sp. UBA7534]
MGFVRFPASLSTAAALLAAAALLSGCGRGEPAKTSTPTPAPTAPVAPPAEPAAPAAATKPSAEAAVALPEGEGREIAQRLCSGCHSLSLVTAQGRTPEEWDATVARMETNGMVAPADDVYAVIDYLSEALPPGK